MLIARDWKIEYDMPKVRYVKSQCTVVSTTKKLPNIFCLKLHKRLENDSQQVFWKLLFKIFIRLRNNWFCQIFDVITKNEDFSKTNQYFALLLTEYLLFGKPPMKFQAKIFSSFQVMLISKCTQQSPHCTYYDYAGKRLSRRKPRS